MEGAIDEVLVEFDRFGSLPATHENQGSDMGLAVTQTSLEIEKRLAGLRQGCGSCSCS